MKNKLTNKKVETSFRRQIERATKKVTIIKHRNTQSRLTFHFRHHDAITEWIPFQHANILYEKEVDKYCNEKLKNLPQK